MLSTAEAARRLGVSPRRVRALVESGELAAERVGRAWAIDEASVQARAEAPKLKGRPKEAARDAFALGVGLLAGWVRKQHLIEKGRSRTNMGVKRVQARMASGNLRGRSLHQLPPVRLVVQAVLH